MNLEKNVKTVLFDLDGTLVDHFSGICRCYNQVLEEFGHPKQPFQDLKKLIGPPIGPTAEKLLQTHDKELVEKYIRRYREIMEKTFRDGLRILDGTHWILQNLRTSGVQTAVFSNKQQNQAQQVCEALSISPLLSLIMGTGSEINCLRKPDVKFTQKILTMLQADPTTTIMVGDSDIDMATGSLAHLLGTYGIATGTHTMEELKNCPYPPTDVFADLWKFGQTIFSFQLPSK
jgi:phosphoglycolate phosphatase-like HAD superfamily hydrolase